MKLLNQKFCIGLLLFVYLSPALAKVEGIIGPIPIEQNENLALALPQTSNPEIIISRSQYIISYNKARRAPNYVAWKVVDENLGSTGRSEKFATDTELQSYLDRNAPGENALTPADYSGSCFDRGHMAPSADRTNKVEDNEATFLMSNMAPQTPFVNRVVWEHLEVHTRSMIRNKNRRAYVIAGPIYDQNLGLIGPKHLIPVPSKFFKIIFLLHEDQSAQEIDERTPLISVVIPNVLEDGKNPMQDRIDLCKNFEAVSGDTHDWEKYQMPVAEIEKLSGIRIFPGAVSPEQ